MLFPTLALTLAASPPPPTAEGPPHVGIHSDLELEETLIGDPWDVRSRLAERGVHFHADLTIDWTRNFRGGLRRSSGVHHLLMAEISLDLDELLSLPGGLFLIEFQNNDGDLFSDRLTGDLQGYSDISEDRRTQISQLWYQQSFFDELLRVKVGKVDANTEFAFVENAGEFLNASMGVSPTIFVMPTYPDPATSINVFVAPHDAFQLGFGFYDGALQRGVRTGSRGPSTFFDSHSDYFLIGEVGMLWSLGSAELPGRLGVGGWHHTGTFERFSGGRTSGTSGFYLVADQKIWRTDLESAECDRGIGAFLQYGYADRAVSELHHHIGGGLTWTGPIASREQDVIGLGATYVHFSSPAGFDGSGELAVELFYQAQITPWLIVQPDIQYIRNPGGNGTRDVLVGTLRFGVSF